MSLEVADQIRSQLPRTVECGLPAPEGFVEFGLPVGAKVGYLRGGEGAEFAPAAGVGGRGLKG